MELFEDRMPHLFGAGREPQRAPAKAARPARPAAQPRARRVPRRATVKLDGELVTLVPIGDMAAAVAGAGFEPATSGL